MSNIRRYLLKFSYIGTSYKGSQKQISNIIADIDSVQGAIEYSLRKLNPKNAPSLVFAGRTDAGVHSLCMTAHMDLDEKWTTNHYDTSVMVRMLNRSLIQCNHEIRILSAHEVSKNFHARFSAKSRTYLYRIMLAKDPLDHRVPIAESGRTLHLNFYPEKFDIERMKQGVKLFCGKWDFMTFSAYSHNKRNDQRQRSYVRTLNVNMSEAEPLMPFDPLSKNFNYWHLEFKSKSFLYNQIRRIVGCLIGLGNHKISEEDVMNMLQVPSHHNWDSRISPAAPHGLYLTNVEYDEDIVQKIFRNEGLERLELKSCT